MLGSRTKAIGRFTLKRHRHTVSFLLKTILLLSCFRIHIIRILSLHDVSYKPDYKPHNENTYYNMLFVIFDIAKNVFKRCAKKISRISTYSCPYEATDQQAAEILRLAHS